MFSEHLDQRLKQIKKSAIMTQSLTPEQMIVRAFELISFAKNAPLHVRIVEDD